MPMRENIPADRCEICGETIFSGDLAYFVMGHCCCFGCIESSAYIADGSVDFCCDNTDEHLFGVIPVMGRKDDKSER